MYFAGKIGCYNWTQHDTYEDAVEWIDEQIENDPAGFATGKYYIDGPEQE